MFHNFAHSVSICIRNIKLIQIRYKEKEKNSCMRNAKKENLIF